MLTKHLSLAGTVLVAAGAAWAGGSPENVLIIVNPGSAESMYIADYYKNARNIPDANVLYLEPTAAASGVGSAPYSVAAGLNGDLDGLFGYLRNAGLADHIDYIVVVNTGAFFTDIPGLITDGCWPVARMSQSSLFTTAFMRGTILAGNLPSTTGNQYAFTSPNEALAFSSNTGYVGGFVSTAGSAKHYYIGAQLGYTGPLGNTVSDILTMIDRCAAVDGTHPGGTFYYMNNLADPIRNMRACGSLSGCNGSTTLYDAAVNAIVTRGGAAQVLTGMLPTGRQDCLGVMTGDAAPPIDTENMTLLPGAFCDHLTSWAATFDNVNQVKASAWIRRGAAGTEGAVEEPCAYPGKFPHANMHALYYQGLSLGESYFRTMAYVPFQNLLLGDPITRPWATFPTIVSNAPSGNVGGRITFTPSASTTVSGASIAGLSLYVDGVFHSTHTPGQAFSLNTAAIADGWHELRLLAWDSTPIRNTGRWVGSINVNNLGRAATLQFGAASGDMTTLFAASVSGVGGTVQEMRLIQNGRVVAAGAGPVGGLSVYGRNLGSGQSRVQAEAIFTDGRTARSAPATLNVGYATGTFSGLAPVAYSYTKRVARNGAFVVELPARFDDGLSNATFAIVTPPSQSSVGPGTRSSRVMTASANACGQDQFTFRVTTPSGQSNLGTVTLVYGPGPVCLADVSGDGALNVLDFSFFINLFATQDLRADIDGSCQLNVLDFGAFLNAFASGCP